MTDALTPLSGLINLNKPPGISSAKALYRVRKVVQQRKSGHAGTLDPAADGVLLLCLGRGTKLVERLMDLPKVYRATARLDMTSTSYDADHGMTPVDVAAIPSEQQVIEAAARFEGEIEQIPPAVSALKVRGQPAYKLAHQGKPPELKPRRVRMYWLHVERYAWPEVTFQMACGRGTYVRALIRDWGAALGVGGCLTALTRTAVGPFNLSNAWTLDALETAATDDYVLSLDQIDALLQAAQGQSPPRP